MTDALDSAIRDALLAYARSQGPTRQDNGRDDAEDLKHSEDVDNAQPEDVATTMKKSKMLRVARMLVDSNPRIRNKGMASVGSFLDNFQELTEDELLNVWSTLYYAAWLTDKPLVQRDFFVRASLLHRRLRCPRAKSLFFCSFFRVLIAEWGKLDRHRTNKFLLFCRIFLAEWMHVMRLMKWERTFVKEAVEFLCEEVMLHGSARGVALHVVDVLTDEFQVLLDPVAHPASSSKASDTARTRAQEQEERLCAFSWLFVPFLRCCCFSTDAALVARIHERSLRKLGLQDVDLRFVAAALFALASDKRVRSENRKQLFASHEHVREEATGATFDNLESSDSRLGGFTVESFAQLMVQRVISDTITKRQQPDKLFHDSMKQLPNMRKRSAPSDGCCSVAEARSPAACGDVASNTGTAVLSKETKRTAKGSRLKHARQRQHHETAPSPSETQTADEFARGGPERKARKNKQRKMCQASQIGVHASCAAEWDPANDVRLPIVSSVAKGSHYAANDKSNSATCMEATSRSGVLDDPAESRLSPADSQSAGLSTSSEAVHSAGDCTFESLQEPADSEVTAPSKEIQAERPLSRRRSLRITGAAPGNKRVLFNLRKNKVVAFSRHAPSLAVGPASPPPQKGNLRSSTSEQKLVRGCPSAGAPLRGILREAKKLGPPTKEETAPMPPIVKSNRPPWWGGATAELMAILRRALSQSTGKDQVSGKQKKKKGVKQMKRAARTKDLFGS